MLNLASYLRVLIVLLDVVNANCVSKTGHLQFALVFRSKTKSADVFNELLD